MKAAKLSISNGTSHGLPVGEVLCSDPAMRARGARSEHGGDRVTAANTQRCVKNLASFVSFLRFSAYKESREAQIGFGRVVAALH